MLEKVEVAPFATYLEIAGKFAGRKLAYRRSKMKVSKTSSTMSMVRHSVSRSGTDG